MAETGREVERKSSLEAGWQGLGPVLKWTVSWSETRERRARRFGRKVGHEVGLGETQLDELLERDEQRRDLYVAGLLRVTQVADEDYRDALGRLIGAAFSDDARIEERGLLASQVLLLNPLHLRVLGETLAPNYCFSICDRLPRVVPLNLLATEKSLRVTSAALSAAIEGLMTAGFLTRGRVDLPAYFHRRDLAAEHASFGSWQHAIQPQPVEIAASDWGRAALAMYHPFSLAGA